MQDDVRQLLAAIRETADAERADIRAQAGQEIAKISERTEAQVKQFRDKALAKLEDQVRTESECIVGRARLEIRDRLVQEKNEALEEVFELASKQIAAMDDSKTRKEIFKRLVQEAIGRINSEDVHLRIAKTDLSLWESLKANFPTSIMYFTRLPRQGLEPHGVRALRYTHETTYLQPRNCWNTTKTGT